tara:strand:- start:1150 stop:1578 length:429 start_codon:yes stop_codon:yes gene_type:complete
LKNNFNLKRFVDAQSLIYERALFEIKNGRKSSHWMWFIFPQYRDIGSSKTSLRYAINSEEEAISYLKHPILGLRLLEITKAFLSIENKTAHEILGTPDEFKIQSSMTLFDAIQSENKLFSSVLHKYFDGNRCEITLLNINNQ